MIRKLIFAAVTALAASAAFAQAPESYPSTASYGLFPIEGNSVGGYVQVAEQEGQTRVTVSLTNIAPGSQYLPVLFEGTCGPDREMVEALNPVGSFVNDPFVSIDTIDIPVSQIEQTQYFMYIFQGGELPATNEAGFLSTDTALACGQIGLGANR